MTVMSDAVWVALIVAAGPLILGIINAVVNRKRHAENRAVLAETKANTEETKHSVNAEREALLQKLDGLTKHIATLEERLRTPKAD